MSSTNNKHIGETIVLISIFRESLIGGVAVHSSNLYERLKENYVPVKKVDYAKVFQKPGLIGKMASGVSLGMKLIWQRINGVKIFHFHASNQAIVFYLFGPLLALLDGKIILSIHSGYGYDRWLTEHPFYDFLNRIVFRVLSNLVFMNPEESERIRQRYPFLRDNVETVNPFIAPTEKELSNVLRSPVDPDVYKIVTIGAWGERYNVEEAVEAANLVRAKISADVSLTILQSTSLIEPEYRKRVLSRIDELNGLLEINLKEDVTNVLPVLANHDVFVRPSKGDSYGLCVAEALVVGTPAIVTNICRRCSTAVLYDQGDMKTLVKELVAIYSRRETINTNSLLSPKEDSYNGYLEVYSKLR